MTINVGRNYCSKELQYPQSAILLNAARGAGWRIIRPTVGGAARPGGVRDVAPAHDPRGAEGEGAAAQGTDHQTDGQRRGQRETDRRTVGCRGGEG